MEIKDKCPEYITGTKVWEWNDKITKTHEQVFPDDFELIGGKYCNWLLFYCWCYARTQGFTNKCVQDWDILNYGGKYKTLREGIQDALSEFIKYPDTEYLKEQKEVEKLYKEIDDYCKGIIYAEPHPLPEEPKPIPPTVPMPLPEKPEPTKTYWKPIVLALLALLSTVSGFVWPTWVKQIINLIISILS